MKNIERRDFLKIMAAIPTSMVLSKLISQIENSTSSAPNIIVIVLDALTARDMSLYGYPRDTTPNIERFAACSNVYHSHYSAGAYTTSGTASLLTGTYPWTHRAINIRGLVARKLYKRNIFHLLESHYNRIGFSQNRFVTYLLGQFAESIDQYIPRESFSKLELNATDVKYSDFLVKSRVIDDFLFRLNSESGSLILGTLNKIRKLDSFQNVIAYNFQYSTRELIFDITDIFSGLASHLISLNSELPSFCYFHLFPPHAPYIPAKEFRRLFKDDWKPIAKPRNPLEGGYEVYNTTELNEERLKYDQFIATTDSALGEFLDEIGKAGLLENSYVILTSDHGESFERGYWGHTGPFVYDPGIHIPLLISAPGQTARHDFHSVTNSVDLIPTILNISGLEIPDWCEGEILPGMGRGISNDRLTFSMDAKKASAFGNLSPITIAMYQGDYKIIYYEGYEEKDSPYNKGLFELYNFRDDPEELHNLINTEKSIAQQMQEQLLDAYHTANQPLQ